MIDTGVFECRWQGCGLLFISALDCFNHVKLQHIHRTAKHCLWHGCTKISQLRSNLVSHINKHIPINTDVCYICDRPFKWQGDYRRHNKRHTPEQRRFNDMANSLFK